MRCRSARSRGPGAAQLRSLPASATGHRPIRTLVKNSSAAADEIRAPQRPLLHRDAERRRPRAARPRASRRARRRRSSGGVTRRSSSTANRLDIVPQTSSPLAVDRIASSQPVPASLARASTFSSRFRCLMPASAGELPAVTGEKQARMPAAPVSRRQRMAREDAAWLARHRRRVASGRGRAARQRQAQQAGGLAHRGAAQFEPRSIAGRAPAGRARAQPASSRRRCSSRKRGAPGSQRSVSNRPSPYSRPRSSAGTVSAATPSTQQRRHAAAPSAASTPRALARVSSSSRSGTESATMPAPARSVTASPTTVHACGSGC